MGLNLCSDSWGSKISKKIRLELGLGSKGLGSDSPLLADVHAAVLKNEPPNIVASLNRNSEEQKVVDTYSADDGGTDAKKFLMNHVFHRKSVLLDPQCRDLQIKVPFTF